MLIRKIFLFSALLFMLNPLQSQNGWREGEMEVLISTEQLPDVQILLQKGINFDLAKSDGSQVRAYMIPVEFNWLKTTGLKYTVSIPDLNDHYRGYWDNPAVPPGYYTYQQIIDIADSLALNFPLICKKIIAGTSYGGRQLAVLKISDNVNIDEPEPEILFDGGIHGDEVGASENMIRYARDLCRWYSTNPVYTDLINNREIFIYLMVNPDGRVNMSRYNQNTVDINRDGGYMWNGEGNSPGAYSQLETKALRNFMYDNQFVVYTNYHSGIEIVSYPWSYRPDAVSDLSHIDQLASVYSSSSGYPILTYGQGYHIMYAINGSMKDIAYGITGNVGWSIEISESKQPPQSQIQMFYSYNVPAMTEMINRAGYGAEGLVTDSLTGEPIRATVWVNGYYPVFTDPLVGDYHKYVLPGTNYSIRVTAPGYQTKTISGITVPSTGSVVTDFQLIPDSNWYAYRVISCYIPNNNFGDEGYTPGVLGAPDNVAYSLGRNGWIVIDMGDTVFNGPGNDIKVIQAGSTPENFQCTVGSQMDGPWTVLGVGLGTTEFDLGLVSKARYLRIKDLTAGVNSGPDIGFDLDAIEMLTPPIKVKFEANEINPCQYQQVDFTDLSTGNGISWEWNFPGGTPSFSTEQHPTGIKYNLPGIYDVALTVSNGFSSSTSRRTGYITVKDGPDVDLGTDTTLCSWESITLDAGNPGAQYLWSTGATSQTIVVDSTGTGNGSALIWAEVSTLNGCSSTDSVIVTFDPCTHADGNAPESAEILIWPNPAHKKCHVRSTLPGHSTFSLFDLTGQTVSIRSVQYAPDYVTLDIANVKPGIYYLRITHEHHVATKKLIVQ